MFPQPPHPILSAQTFLKDAIQARIRIVVGPRSVAATAAPESSTTPRPRQAAEPEGLARLNEKTKRRAGGAGAASWLADRRPGGVVGVGGSFGLVLPGGGRLGAPAGPYLSLFTVPAAPGPPRGARFVAIYGAGASWASRPTLSTSISETTVPAAS